MGAHSEGSRRLEGPIAVPQEHRDAVGTIVGDCQIQLPITIEVALGYVPREARGDKYALRQLEGAVAVAKKHPNVPIAKVGDR